MALSAIISAIATPSWCRVSPHKDESRGLSIWLNLLFALCGGFSSACLFYTHPILHILAEDFHTTQAGVATIPSLAQAGEACCLLLIMPLADFVPRRHFTLVTVAIAALFWLGLCITTNLAIFNALTFLSALFTCVVHVVIPLVSELSTPANRAFNLSIVGVGPTLGILLARILSGVIADFTSWREVYWMGLGIQVAVFIALYLFMPDYPSINKLSTGQLLKTYPRILWSIITLYGKHAVLVQACLLAFISFAPLTAYWTTLTFLLSEAPYNFNTTVIGLFGLIGGATLLIGPFFGKFVITPLRVPLYSVLLGNTLSLVGVVCGTFTGLHTVAGPVIEAILLDAGLIIVFIANRLSIEGVEPGASNRVNTAFMLIMHLGQLVGTKGGNEVYERYGGWIMTGVWCIGILAVGYIVAIARGPYEPRWIGWQGGWKPKDLSKNASQSKEDDEEKASGETLASRKGNDRVTVDLGQ